MSVMPILYMRLAYEGGGRESGRDGDRQRVRVARAEGRSARASRPRATVETNARGRTKCARRGETRAGSHQIRQHSPRDQ